MDQFELNILGCGSAFPTTRHSSSSQIINFRGKLYMIDCGEGSQLQFCAMKLKFQRLNHVFISHLHGDHCLGLVGLVSTLGLLGRVADFCIYSQPDAESLFRPLIKYFCKNLPFKLAFYFFNPVCSELIFEDHTLKVSTIPLKHRVPTVGFLFEEKPQKPHITQEMMDFYHIPINMVNNIKNGNDFITCDGQIISNLCLPKLAGYSRKYAYCSDTAYYEKIIPLISGVNLLYHEATFNNEDLARAKETYHSSAQHAALIAKAASVKKLILGHFSARYSDETLLLNEAQKIFPNTIVANERMILPISPE